MANQSAPPGLAGGAVAQPGGTGTKNEVVYCWRADDWDEHDEAFVQWLDGTEEGRTFQERSLAAYDWKVAQQAFGRHDVRHRREGPIRRSSPRARSSHRGRPGHRRVASTRAGPDDPDEPSCKADVVYSGAA
jgi:hypothetical protein